MGLDKHLPKMAAYYDKAREIAAVLLSMEDIEIKPNPPHCNMMQVYFRRERQRFWNAALDMAEESGTLVIGNCAVSPIPAYCMTELVIGEAALDLPTNEIAALFAELMRRSKSN